MNFLASLNPFARVVSDVNDASSTSQVPLTQQKKRSKRKAKAAGSNHSDGLHTDFAALPAFEDIAAAFESYQQRIRDLEAQSVQHEGKLKKLEDQLKSKHDALIETQNALAQAISENSEAQQLLTVEQSNFREAQLNLASFQQSIAGGNTGRLAKIGPVKPFVNHLESQRRLQNQRISTAKREQEGLAQEKSDISKKLSMTEENLSNLAGQIIDLKTQNQELQRLVTHLKLDTKADDPQTPIEFPPLPFVLVLVDGDAYKWCNDLYAKTDKTHTSPGGLAAHNLKSEITQYILAHPDQIPPQSKIVARVLRNAGQYMRKHPTAKRQDAKLLTVDFMTKFTEAMPLFDYYDAGSGKERVDTKIHETIHLFIHNPLCRKLFLACSSDNGFARVLEQYNHDPTARSKMCLISSGWQAPEIARLDLEEIEIPSVFARMLAPLASTVRDQKLQQKEQERTKREKDVWIAGVLQHGEDQWRRILLERAIAADVRAHLSPTSCKELCAQLRHGWSCLGVGCTFSGLEDGCESSEATEQEICVDDGVD